MLLDLDRPTSRRPALTWDDLQETISLSFSVWDMKEKQEWLRQAWRIIEDADLAWFDTEVERAEVVIRFLALAAIFADFYELAFQDGHKPDYDELAESLDVSKFRVGQLIGRDSDFEDEEDERSIYSDALRYLANKERFAICLTLTEGYGSVSQLFISLWRTGSVSEDVTDEDIVSTDLTPEKLTSFEWLREGCYPCE